MDFLIRVAEWFKKQYRMIDRKYFVPAMMWIVQFFSTKIRLRIEGEEGLADWKKEALKDFRFWLEDLPNLPPAPERAPSESCDLFTLLSEFTSLKQEIKMQNREQEKSLQSIDTFINAYREAANLFKEKSKSIEKLEENIRLAAERRAVLPFLDIRDALTRGLRAGKEVAVSGKGLFSSAPKGIEGVIEGYEMAIRRFDRALESVGILPIQTVSQPFNPKTMKAMDKRSASDTEKGVVVEELISGFIRGGEVIRFAEVVVGA